MGEVPVRQVWRRLTNHYTSKVRLDFNLIQVKQTARLFWRDSEPPQRIYKISGIWVYMICTFVNSREPTLSFGQSQGTSSRLTLPFHIISYNLPNNCSDIYHTRRSNIGSLDWQKRAKGNLEKRRSGCSEEYIHENRSIPRNHITMHLVWSLWKSKFLLDMSDMALSFWGSETRSITLIYESTRSRRLHKSRIA